MVKFGPYVPYNKDSEAYTGVTTIRDDSGKDWYEQCADFSTNESKFYVMTDNSRVIISYANAADVLFPMNMIVWQMNTAPKGITIGKQLYEDGTVGPYKPAV